jgi:hypothetical protein
MSSPQKISMVRILVMLASAASLAICLIAPMLFLLGRLNEGSYKASLLAGSVGWFLGAAVLAFGKSKTEAAAKT